jgi:hypothetical protein
VLLRLIGGSPAATTLTLAAPGTTTGYTLLYPGLSWGDQTWTHEFSGARGTLGQHSASGIVGNRTVVLPIRIAGTTKDDMTAKLAALERLVGQEMRRFGGMIAWQSNNQTPRQWFRVLTATTQLQVWDSRAEVLTRAVVLLSFVCAPPVEGDPCDLFDNFLAAAITDYTFDTGSMTMDNVNGRMACANTSLAQFWHNLSGYSVTDAEVTIHYQLGSTSSSVGAMLRRKDASNFLVGEIDNTATQLTILKVVAGVGTGLGQIALGLTLSTGTDYWLRFRAEGNVLTAEHWTSVPTPQGTPTKTVAAIIGSADLAAFGRTVKGLCGVRVTAAGTPANTFLDDLRVWPYTYRSITPPREIELLSLPGSLDPACDWWVFSPTNAHAFGLLGWARKPVDVFNWVWNGGFEYPFGSAGWSTASNYGHNAATSVANTGQALYGAAGGRVVTPGSASFEGVSFTIYRRFERGRPYTFSFWARSNTGAAQTITLRIGTATTNEGLGGAVSLPSSGAWVQASVVWYPTAEVEQAWASVLTNGTNAYTFDLDGVQVFEGTVAPTVQTQTQGRGGYPPVGRLNAASAYSFTNWGIAADAATISGYSAQFTTGAGGFSLGAQWIIDPGLVWTDEYQQAAIDLEVWARVNLSTNHSAVTCQVYAFPLMATATPIAFVYTREYGAGYKSVTNIPTVSQAFRLIRAGTIPLPAGAAGAQRNLWALGFSLLGTSSAPASCNLDHLLLIPARARCLSPSGANKASGYPKFIAPTSGITTRLVKSDLTGFWGSQGVSSAQIDLAATHGLGGSPIELPIEDHYVIPRVYANVPDGEQGTDADFSVANYAISTHFALTPRWAHARDV